MFYKNPSSYESVSYASESDVLDSEVAAADVAAADDVEIDAVTVDVVAVDVAAEDMAADDGVAADGTEAVLDRAHAGSTRKAQSMNGFDLRRLVSDRQTRLQVWSLISEAQKDEIL